MLTFIGMAEFKGQFKESLSSFCVVITCQKLGCFVEKNQERFTWLMILAAEKSKLYDIW